MQKVQCDECGKEGPATVQGMCCGVAPQGAEGWVMLDVSVAFEQPVSADPAQGSHYVATHSRLDLCPECFTKMRLALSTAAPHINMERPVFYTGVGVTMPVRA